MENDALQNSNVMSRLGGQYFLHLFLKKSYKANRLGMVFKN